MIEYVEIRDEISREVIGIIDTAKTIIWRSTYYGVGDFEIYTLATASAIALLQEDNLVTRLDDINCGIIEKVNIVNNEKDGRMISASGRFAKSILDRRLIYEFENTYFVKPTIIKGNVAEATWKLIDKNCGTLAIPARKFNKFSRGAFNYLPQIIVDNEGNADEKQVTYKNLLSYTDTLLQEYGIGAYVWLDGLSLDLQYVMYQGEDRSVDNTKGNEPLIFSTEFDNLLSSEYSINKSVYKNMAIIGGQELTIQASPEIKKRFVSRLGDNLSGYDRREVFVEASSLQKTYKDTSGVDHTYTDEQYNKILIQQGKQGIQPLQKLKCSTEN